MTTEQKIRQQIKRVEQIKKQIKQLDLVAESYWRINPKQLLEGMSYKIKADKLRNQIAGYIVK